MPKMGSIALLQLSTSFHLLWFTYPDYKISASCIITVIPVVCTPLLKQAVKKRVLCGLLLPSLLAYP